MNRFNFNVIFSIFYALAIVCICLCFNPNFFNIDDALDEMLGFFYKYGESWSSGRIPFIIDDMFIGGNSIIDLGKGVFTPQNILGSLITYHLGFYYTGIFLAVTNISLVTISAIYIAKFFKISTLYRYIFASFIAIQPIFLYQYTAGWWNASNGQTWAIVSIATYLLLQYKLTPYTVILNFMSVLFMLSSGWPHGVIGYSIVVAVLFLYNLISNNRRKSILIPLLPSVFSLLCSLPIYSEYIYSSDLINRATGYNNDGRFMLTSWSSILLGFNPAHYDYMHYFGGYRLITVPIAFTTLFGLLVFFYRDIIKVFINRNAKFSILLILVITYFILSQLPTQFGPLRWSFRFVPFLSLFVCLSVFYLMSYASRNNLLFNIKYYYLAVFLTSLLTIFNSFGYGDNYKYIILQIVSMAVLIILPHIKITNIYKSVMFSLVSLCIMLVGERSLGGKYVPYFDLSTNIKQDLNINLDGYYASFTGDWLLGGYPNKETINDLNSSQFGLYNIRTISGYSPVGNIKLDTLLPQPSAHGHLQIQGLRNILTFNQEFNVCISSLMRVSTIAISRPDYEAFRNDLIRCGYTELSEASNNDLFVFLPKSSTVGWKQNLPSIFPNINVNVIDHTNNTEVIDIPQRDSNVSIIFPRVWWKGYIATFNGKDIPVHTDNTGVLVKVELPQGEKGRLELKYFPKTWGKLFWLVLFMIFTFIVFVFYVHKMRRKNEKLLYR